MWLLDDLSMWIGQGKRVLECGWMFGTLPVERPLHRRAFSTNAMAALGDSIASEAEC